MQGNYRPNVTGTDEGFWRRMLLVPWNVTIGEGEVDVALPDKLKAEASGILNRLLDGLRDYLDHGVSPTAEIIEATANYRESSDPIGRFMSECAVLISPTQDPPQYVGEGEKRKTVRAIFHEMKVGPDGRKLYQARITGKEAFAVYSAWAAADGEKKWGNKGFARGLLDHGVRRLKSSGVYYLDIALTASVEDFEGMEIEQGNEQTYKKKHD
jgi:putative DNA primase/helicase